MEGRARTKTQRKETTMGCPNSESSLSKGTHAAHLPLKHPWEVEEAGIIISLL